MAVTHRARERATTRFVRMAIVEGELPARELSKPNMLNEVRVFLAMDYAVFGEWMGARLRLQVPE